MFVRDLQSTNGTQVNGTEIGRDAAARNRGARLSVRLVDTVRAGAVTLCVHRTTEDHGASVPDLESHDAFVSLLEHEILRAKTFGHQLGLIQVRSGSSASEHMGRWYPRIRELFRSVDRGGLYSADTVEIAVLETSEEEVFALLDRVVEEGTSLGIDLRCGSAMFPQDAANCEELVENARVPPTGTRRRSRRRRALSREVPRSAFGRPIPLVRSPAMRKIYETAQQLADSVIPVLVCGETGTGKELVAEAIHFRGGRRQAPLRCVNCAAIPDSLVESTLFGYERGAFTGAKEQTKGVFEQANGGTVFLDEIGELPILAQAALLRVLETKRFSRVGSSREIAVDVRIVAATNRDLEAANRRGEFRADLLYRLNAIQLSLPALRERPEEIVPLAKYFVEQANADNKCSVRTIDPAAERLLSYYAWPGNVRELRNAIHRAVAISDGVTIPIRRSSGTATGNPRFPRQPT